MIMRLVTAALAAAFTAGIVVAVLEETTTAPLIIAAEQYEDSGHHAAAPHAHEEATGHATASTAAAAQADTHHHDPAEWAPADGLERTFFTSITTIGTMFGFGLILLAGMILTGARIDARSGLIWGASAFAAAGLAPALGLSPELPGAAAAALADRQVWWAGTVIATAAGLFLTLRVSTVLAIAGGAVLIVLPHVIGAPHPAAFTSEVPSELAGHFASASLVISAVSWCLTGVIAGFVWDRFGAHEKKVAFA